MSVYAGLDQGNAGNETRLALSPTPLNPKP